ncbi:hypothetical protein [Enterobacter hormaechei]|uniref:hypothetical protein n=1 Tax=Enterobacter hormaechei TaxID=158836 RepID=UPI00140239D9|nr:hypothetical protein [Enterobacter hormaechei]
MDAYISINMISGREENGQRRTAAQPRSPQGELPFPEVQACGRVGKEKGADGEPATPS